MTEADVEQSRKDMEEFWGAIARAASGSSDADLEEALKQRALNEAAVRRYVELGFSREQAEQRAVMDLERKRLEEEIERNRENPPDTTGRRTPSLDPDPKA